MSTTPEIYEYALLKYAPDKMTGDSITIGVVVCNTVSKAFKYKVKLDSTRLKCVAPQHDDTHLRFVRKYVISRLEEYSTPDRKKAERRKSHVKGTEHLFDPVYGLKGAIDNMKFSVDDPFSWSEVRTGVTTDFNNSVSYLYGRCLSPKKERSDNNRKTASAKLEDVFVKFQARDVLKPRHYQDVVHSVTFNNTIKNGALNIYEALELENLLNIGLVDSNVNMLTGKFIRISESLQKDDAHLNVVVDVPHGDIRPTSIAIARTIEKSLKDLHARVYVSGDDDDALESELFVAIENARLHIADGEDV